MRSDPNEKLYQTWENRWKGSKNIEQLTPLGKLMHKRKQIIVKKLIKDLDVTNMLEVGCGLGYILPVFQDAGWDCLGIDVSKEAIEVCKQKMLPVQLKKVEDVKEKYDLIFTERRKDFYIKDTFKNIKFPEFTNKKANEVMPFNAGFIGINNINSAKKLLNTCLNLQKRFH